MWNLGLGKKLVLGVSPCELRSSLSPAFCTPLLQFAHQAAVFRGLLRTGCGPGTMDVLQIQQRAKPGRSLPSPGDGRESRSHPAVCTVVSVLRGTPGTELWGDHGWARAMWSGEASPKERCWARACRMGRR